MTRSNHSQGTFCWVELIAHDWGKAKEFYSQLFDWDCEDQPIGEGLFYTMLKKRGEYIGAMYQMPVSRIAEREPSHWLSYIAVDDVDAVVANGERLGARLLAGPHDVGGAGRMAMMEEPGGAIFALWQGKDHPGAGRLREPGSVFWHELASRNVEASRGFYSALVGWEIQDQPMENINYTLCLVNGQPGAGMLQMTSEWGEEVPPHWMVYFAVENCDESASQAADLGAAICVPPTDIPEVGRFCVLTDPQGGVFSIIQSFMD